MKNRVLHALSNRQGPFQTSLFGSSPDFTPRVMSPAEAQLRSALMLDVTDNDYFLKSYLSVLAAFPDIASILGPDVTSYRISDFKPVAVEVEGGELADLTSLEGVYLDNVVNRFPIVFTYHVDFHSLNSCTLTEAETGNTQVCNVLVSGNAPMQTLRVSWPAGIPFNGAILLNGPWVKGCRVTLRVEPSQFPCRQIIERVSRTVFLTELLAGFGWVDAFLHSFNDTEQLAMILAAVAYLNLSKTPTVTEIGESNIDDLITGTPLRPSAQPVAPPRNRVQPSPAEPPEGPGDSDPRLIWTPANQVVDWYTEGDWAGDGFEDVTLEAFQNVEPATVGTLEFWREINQLTGIQNLALYTNLVSLSFYGQMPAVLTATLNQALPASLLGLYFYKSSVTSENLTKIQTLVQLHELGLSNNELTTLDLSELELLTYLDAMDNALTPPVIDQIFIHLDSFGLENGTCLLLNNNPPTSVSEAARNSLVAKGWTLSYDVPAAGIDNICETDPTVWNDDTFDAFLWDDVPATEALFRNINTNEVVPIIKNRIYTIKYTGEGVVKTDTGKYTLGRWYVITKSEQWGQTYFTRLGNLTEYNTPEECIAANLNWEGTIDSSDFFGMEVTADFEFIGMWYADPGAYVVAHDKGYPKFTIAGYVEV